MTFSAASSGAAERLRSTRSPQAAPRTHEIDDDAGAQSIFREGRPSGALVRLSGGRAALTGALALFAPLAIFLLSAAEAPSWTFIAAIAAAAPLIAVVAAGLTRPIAPEIFALALAPLALGAAWFAWSTSAALPATASPAAPWAFAAVAAIAILGGRIGALGAFALLLLLGAAFAFAPAPAQNLQYLGQSENFVENRRLISVASWCLALAALGGTAWAAARAWIEALPPLRRPTVAARQALSMLADDSAVAGLRVSGDGVVLQALGAPEGAMDLPRSEIRGVDLASLTHPDDLPQVQHMIEAARKTGDKPTDGASATALVVPNPRAKTPARAATVRMKSRSGAFEWVEIAAVPAQAYPAPMRSEASDQDAILIVRSRWRSGDAIASEAHSADAAFLAQVNSDLRRSVKSIHGYTEILSNEIFGPLGSERYRDYAKMAHEDASKTLGLVDELLDLAEIEAGRFVANAELIDPVPLIDGAVRNLTQTAERLGVALTPHFPPNAPYIRVDRRALRRALAGLGLDALRRAEIGDQVELRIDSEEGAVRFSVVVKRNPPQRPASGTARLAAPAHPSGAASAPGPQTPEEEAERNAMRAAGRLSRLVARSLVERMNGAIFIAPDRERPTAQKPLIASEAIFETPRSVSADDRTEQASGFLVKSATSLSFAPDDDEAQAAARKARDAQQAAQESLNHPLFSTDKAPEEPSSADTETGPARNGAAE